MNRDVPDTYELYAVYDSPDDTALIPTFNPYYAMWKHTSSDLSRSPPSPRRTTSRWRSVLEVAGAAIRELEVLGNTVVKGDALSSPAFVHRSMKVAYRDYTASVIASNVGTHLMMSVSYQSIPAAAVASR